MIKKTLFLFLCGTSLNSAHAARQCEDPAVVNARVADSTENEYFAEAAVLCLMKFEKALEVSKATVAAKSAVNAAKDSATQASKQNNAMLDYKLSKDSLDRLIAQAKQAQEETAEYFDSVVWPEDFDEPEITGPDLDAYLNSDPDYKDNRDLIANVLSDFYTYIAELEAARDGSEQLEAATSGNQSTMSSLGTSSVSAKPTKAAAPAPTKKDKQRQSDITGTKPKTK
jgi:hypothetical protein